jgi:hypothetical protein
MIRSKLTLNDQDGVKPPQFYILTYGFNSNWARMSMVVNDKGRN